MNCHRTVISSIKTALPEGEEEQSVPRYIFKFVHLLLIAILLTACDQSDQNRPVAGQITGTVAYHESVEGEGLHARDLVVWLPPGYDADTGQRYPVLYMHDGQNIFDPATSYAGVELDGILQPGVEEMLVSLEQWGYREGTHWVFIHDPTAKHFESARAKRFPYALVRTLKGVAAENL